MNTPEYAIEILTNDYDIRIGGTVYLHHNHSSNSGMSHYFDVYVVAYGQISKINHLVAQALGWTDKNSGTVRGVRVTGCGVDMGYHLVYSLAVKMFNDGYALGKREI